MRLLFSSLIYLLFIGCAPTDQPVDIEQIKKEVAATEDAFSAYAGEEGIGNAFHKFAAPDAVIMRGNKIISGKEAIRSFCDDNISPEASLTWTPSFVDVSESGDLAYTYGEYIYSIADSSGTVNESRGIFHTVWKRQPDGTWKFVWD